MVPLLILWLEIHCHPPPAQLRTQTTDKNRIKLLQEIVITLFSSVQPNKSQDLQRTEAKHHRAPQYCSNINYLTREFSAPTFIPIENYGSLGPGSSLSPQWTPSLYIPGNDPVQPHWLGLAGIKMVGCIFISDTIFRRLQNRYSHCDNNSYTIPALKTINTKLRNALEDLQNCVSLFLLSIFKLFLSGFWVCQPVEIRQEINR